MCLAEFFSFNICLPKRRPPFAWHIQAIFQVDILFAFWKLYRWKKGLCRINWMQAMSSCSSQINYESLPSAISCSRKAQFYLAYVLFFLFSKLRGLSHIFFPNGFLNFAILRNFRIETKPNVGATVHRLLRGKRWQKTPLVSSVAAANRELRHLCW
jgi:hypothetical protein